MNIKTKLNIGDEMFPITFSRKKTEIKCEFCDGAGNIELKNKNFTCPECLGEGSKTKMDIESWYVNTQLCGKINKINIEVDKNKINIFYFPNNSCNYFEESKVFASYEEAQAKCDKRNQKGE
jgi:RecJ-like exonuclease